MTGAGGGSEAALSGAHPAPAPGGGPPPAAGVGGPGWRFTGVERLVLALVMYVGFFHGIWAPPLFDRDEGAFSEATREMFERGDFVSTYLNGEPRYDKPILTYWLQAPTALLSGWDEWGTRFPSAVAGSLWILALAFFVRERVDRGAAVPAAVILGTSFWVMTLGRAATADALLNLFIALTIFDLYRDHVEPRDLYRNRAFLWLGLGVLTKGPIAIVVPAGVMGLYHTLGGRLWPALKRVVSPVPLLIFAAVALPWYGVQYAREGQAWIEGFFLRHNVERFMDPMEGHSGSFLYYLPITVVVLLPHVGLLFRAVPTLGRVLREDLDRFLWIWFGFVLVFFTVAGTKLPHYILPGITPLAILMARRRDRLRSRLLAVAPAAFVVAVLLFFPEIWAAVEPRVDDDFARAILSRADEAMTLGRRVSLAAALVALAGVAWTVRTPWRAALGAGVVFAFTLGQAGFPLVGDVQQGPTKEAAAVARQNGWDVVMWGVDMPSFAFYYQDVTPLRQPEPGEVVFTRVTRLGRLENVETLWQKGGVVLARKTE